MALISLTRTEPSGSTKKAQRAGPEQPARVKTETAVSRTFAVAWSPIGAGTRSSIPPSVYLASKSYQVPWATISPGSDASGWSLPRTEHSTSRPGEEASTITRGSWRSARSTAPSRPPSVAPRVGLVELGDPADADARAHPRGLDPERQPHLLAAAPPVAAFDRGELDLG